MDIYLIRHTRVNCEKGICYGQTDVDVAPTFDKELIEIKNKLDMEGFVFYSSPLKRCSSLAKALAGSDFIVDERLKELNFGNWEMKRWDSIDEKDLQVWIDSYVDIPCPNGECFTDVYSRSLEFYNDLLKKNHEKVAIIGHGGVIRSIIAHILQIPLNKAIILNFDYGSITKISINGQMVSVEYINK